MYAVILISFAYKATVKFYIHCYMLSPQREDVDAEDEEEFALLSNNNSNNNNNTSSSSFTVVSEDQQQQCDATDINSLNGNNVCSNANTNKAIKSKQSKIGASTIRRRGKFENVRFF